MRSRSDALFHPAELQTLATLEVLSEAAQRLVVRLLLRRGPVFRVSRLSYPEIVDLPTALDAAVTAGLIRVLEPRSADLDPAPLLATFTRPELRELGTSRLKKGELIAELAGRPEARDWLAGRDRFVVLAARETLDLLLVLFFGNRRQDYSEFVRVDLQMLRYPDYEVDASRPIFPDRTALDAYLEAARRSWLDLSALEPEDLVGILGWSVERVRGWTPGPDHRRRVDPTRYEARLGRRVARRLRLQGRAELAVEGLAALAERGPLSERVDAAIELSLAVRTGGVDTRRAPPLLRGLLAREDLDDLERYHLRRRLALHEKLPHPGKLLQRPPVEEVVLLPAEEGGGPRPRYQTSEGPATVEEAVLGALGGDGVHGENLPFRALFGLLFWDVVFAPIPGMFQHRFQSAPLDVRTRRFHTTRKSILAERLEELRDTDLTEALAAAHRAHEGEACRFVHWEVCPLPLLLRITRGLGTEAVLGIAERIARSPSRHGRGLPDLVVFGEGEGVRLVEVKGPTDNLRLEQELWHHRLLEMGVDVRIVKVRGERPDHS